MSDGKFWHVFGGPPLPRTFTGKRAARRLMRKYQQLGIQASLYAGDDGNNGRNWVLVERRDSGGQSYHLPGDLEERV
jgi:hypothetical protein